MIITKPNEWLQYLNQTLDNTICKVNGDETTFDDAGEQVTLIFQDAIKSRRSVWWVGNGGSAAICSHLSQDIMNKLGIKSLYLGDSSLLTCMANDFGYENVYSKPLELFVHENDILIAVSSSGNSGNIVTCVELAQQKNMKIISLSGMDLNNKLWQNNSHVSFYLPSKLYGIVEVGHEAILHGIIETLWLQMKSK